MILVYYKNKDVTPYNNLEDFLSRFEEERYFTEIFMVTQIVDGKVTHWDEDEIQEVHREYLAEGKEQDEAREYERRAYYASR